MAKTQKWTASTFISLVHENLTDKGHKVKKSDLSWAVKDAFQAAVAAGAPGDSAGVPPARRPASRAATGPPAGGGEAPLPPGGVTVRVRPAPNAPRRPFATAHA